MPIIFLLSALFCPMHNWNNNEQIIKEEITIKPINKTIKTVNTKHYKINKVKELKKLSSNKNPYVYYEVYDYFYGTNKYHKLDFNLQEYTYELCIEYDIENYYSLILCQLYYESKYISDAISESNDYGLAQINISNHKYLSDKLNITDFLDPKQSILCNIYIMSDYLKKYDVESSLFCYNTGKQNGSNAYVKNIMYMWKNGINKISE